MLVASFWRLAAKGVCALRISSNRIAYTRLGRIWAKHEFHDCSNLRIDIISVECICLSQQHIHSFYNLDHPLKQFTHQDHVVATCIKGLRGLGLTSTMMCA